MSGKHWNPCFPEKRAAGKSPGGAYDLSVFVHTEFKGGENMHREEKKPIPWEAVDPKPPVVQSGHMENRLQNR